MLQITFHGVYLDSHQTKYPAIVYSRCESVLITVSRCGLSQAQEWIMVWNFQLIGSKGVESILSPTLVDISCFLAFNSLLLSGRRRNEGGNKKHDDISKLEAVEKKVQGFIHRPRYRG